MREKLIESYLTKRIKALGGKCHKLTGYVGISDQIVLLPGGIVEFVEVKQPQGVLSPAQKRWQNQVNDLGFVTRVVWSFEDVDKCYPEK